MTDIFPVFNRNNNNVKQIIGISIKEINNKYNILFIIFMDFPFIEKNFEISFKKEKQDIYIKYKFKFLLDYFGEFLFIFIFICNRKYQINIKEGEIILNYDIWNDLIDLNDICYYDDNFNIFYFKNDTTIEQYILERIKSKKIIIQKQLLLKDNILIENGNFPDFIEIKNKNLLIISNKEELIYIDLDQCKVYKIIKISLSIENNNQIIIKNKNNIYKFNSIIDPIKYKNIFSSIIQKLCIS